MCESMALVLEMNMMMNLTFAAGLCQGPRGLHIVLIKRSYAKISVKIQPK